MVMVRTAGKAPAVGAWKRKGDVTMCRIITRTELQHLTDNELRALFNRVTRELIQSDPGTPDRRNALANLDTIQIALADRMAAPRLKPPGC